MPRRTEILLSPIGRSFRDSEGGEGGGHADSPLERAQTALVAPETPLAALMECAPGDNPRTSKEDMLPLRDVLAAALDTALTPRERWIFERCVIERQSIRSVAADLDLAKSHVDRIKHAAVLKLREALTHEPIIEEYLDRKGNT
jgi:DNA-directed RNA polymerase specialized sigma24 family protein